jgi:hypothetical protein
MPGLAPDTGQRPVQGQPVRGQEHAGQLIILVLAGMEKHAPVAQQSHDRRQLDDFGASTDDNRDLACIVTMAHLRVLSPGLSAAPGAPARRR